MNQIQVSHMLIAISIVLFAESLYFVVGVSASVGLRQLIDMLLLSVWTIIVFLMSAKLCCSYHGGGERFDGQ